MAMFEWDVTSLTSVNVANTVANPHFYGTHYGVKGYWVKLPGNAPAIGSITLVAVQGANDGLYIIIEHSSEPTILEMIPHTIISYERGGRWINIGSGVAAGVHAGAPVTGNLGSGSREKRLRLYYRSVNEYVGPTA
jgi:hypothetical protein